MKEMKRILKKGKINNRETHSLPDLVMFYYHSFEKKVEFHFEGQIEPLV